MLGSGAALFGKPRSGERVQPTAQAVGKGCKGKQAPKERKKRVSHRRQCCSSPDLLIFSTKDRQPFITAFFCRFAARRDPPFGGVKYWSKP
jgi:hypothetical protein